MTVRAVPVKLSIRPQIQWGAVLSAIPLLLWLSLLIVIPHIRLLIMSFTKHLEGGFYPGYYLQVFRNPVFTRVFFRTILYSAFNTFLTLVVVYPLAFLIAKVLKRSMQFIALLVVAMPFWVSELVQVYAWMNILRETGFLNRFLVEVLGLLKQPVEFLYNRWALLTVLVYSSLLLMLMPIYSVLEELDNAQIEAAQDLGAGWLATFLYVIWPTSLPGVTAGCIMVFTLSVGSYVIPNLVGGEEGLWVTEMIYNRFFIAMNWNLGSAYGFLLLTSTLLLIWLGLRLTRQTLRGAFKYV